ncbi:LOB domain-containing protein 22-like [Durio zibethinus]|uniref:LOB domain-containing protein 22-like n=1 Tax=Durio zibethinus TaxID=66656 RepID=A0A6P5WY39_DURZI|nr:LOB domain-containing protein 22-like [Durio zibethinus]
MGINPRSGSNGTTQACAACKYQRRKCAPDCILAPYFPHDRQRQFQNAHKLFGVSNISKIIKALNPPEKDIAMRTIVFQSDARANDPVGGCYRIIQELQRQIEYSQAELDLVFHQLAICRAQAAHQQQQQQLQTSHLQMQEPAAGDSTLGCEMVNPDPLTTYNSNYYYVQEPLDEQFTVNDNNVHHHMQENYDSWDIQESTTALSSLNIKQSFIKEGDNDYNNEVKPDHGIPCERHEIKFETEELVERRFVPSTQLVMSS